MPYTVGSTMDSPKGLVVKDKNTSILPRENISIPQHVHMQYKVATCRKTFFFPQKYYGTCIEGQPLPEILSTRLSM